MNETRELRSQRLPEGIRFYLPSRQLGAARWVGLVPVLFGLFFAGFACFWMWGAAHSMINSRGDFQWFGILFVLFGVPFVFAGLKVISFGAMIIAGRTEVEIKQGVLRVIEKGGPFRIVQKIPMAQIEQFTVVSPETSTPGPAILASLTQSSHLKIIRTNKTAVENLRGYPREVVQELVDRMTAHWSEFSAGVQNLSKPEVRSEVVRFSGETIQVVGAESERLQAPPNSKVIMEEQGGQVVFTVPPAGFVGASRGLLVFGSLWSLFVMVFTLGMVFVPKGDTNLGGILGMLAFLGIFGAIGAGILAAATNMARRKAMVMANANELKVAEKTIFKSRTHQWPRAELKAISVLPSGMTVNDRPILNLQVVTQVGQPKGFFTGRSVPELEWMATHLRRKLALQAKDS